MRRIAQFLRRARVLYLLLALTAGGAAAQPADAQSRADSLKRHIVAIYDGDGALLGSGASISATGLILTAKHILEQKIGGSAPGYRMSVQVAARRDTEKRTARLVATHPHIDIAILDAPEGTLIPPLFVGGPQEDAAGATWYSIGHPIGRTNDRRNPTMFHTMSGAWSDVDQRDGFYVMPGPPFDTGMSGGPVILGDRIVGVVSFAAQKAHVVPVSVALDYLDLVGFSISDSGLIERKDHVGKLAGKIDGYETILLDIQTDRRWICGLEAAWDPAAPGGLPETLDLTMRSERRLPSQPDLNAQLSLVLDAEVLSEGAPPHPVAGLSAGTKYITRRNAAARFENVIEGPTIDYKLGNAIDTASARLGKVDFRVTVSGISGDFISNRPIDDYTLCCTFRLPGNIAATADGEGKAQWQAEAKRCRNQAREVATDVQ